MHFVRKVRTGPVLVSEVRGLCGISGKPLGGVGSTGMQGQWALANHDALPEREGMELGYLKEGVLERRLELEKEH